MGFTTIFNPEIDVSGLCTFRNVQKQKLKVCWTLLIQASRIQDLGSIAGFLLKKFQLDTLALGLIYIDVFIGFHVQT